VERLLVSIRIGYAEVGGLRRLLNEYDAADVSESYTDSVDFSAAIPVARLAEFEQAVGELSAGRAHIERAS
jgi:putative IMPACT (imprinted ancient) family translation regulator